MTVNPNGTYTANPYPTTAAAGYQGTYGANLPQTNTNLWSQLFPPVPPMSPEAERRNWQQQQNLNKIINPIKATFNRLTGAAPWWGAQINVSGSPDDRQERNDLANMPVGATYPGTAGRGRSGRELEQNPNQNPGMHISPGWTGSGTFTQNAAMQAVLNRLDMGDMSAIDQIPAADLEAMGLGELVKQTGSTATQQSSGNTDFQKTNYYLTHQDVPLEQQTRWDAKKRKYISVGQWMRQERRKFNKKGRYVGDRRSRPSQPAQTPAAEPADTEFHGTIQQAGVVNFNTATG